VIWPLLAVLVATSFWMATPLGAGAQAAGAVVGIAATPSGQGAWVVDRSGRVIPMGDAANLGSANGVPAVALAPTPSGNGYWIADANGGEKLKHKQLTAIEKAGGPSTAAMRGWFMGKTRRPQSPAVEAAGRALGFKRVWKKMP